MTGVLDDYFVSPNVSLLDKTRMQAQVLVPVLRALRAELGKDKADAIVKRALRDWSKQLFAAIGGGIAAGLSGLVTLLWSLSGTYAGEQIEKRSQEEW